MGSTPISLLSIFLVLAASTVSCTDPPSTVDGDADADGDVEQDADEDVEAGADADAPDPGGPLLLVARSVLVAPDRRCDVDGDGALDNAVADLGTSAAATFVMAFNAALSAGMNPTRHPTFHIPWIDNLSAPDGRVSSFAVSMALDADWPRDPSDDLSGDEPLYTGADELDRDGEPEYMGTDLLVESGEISGGGGVFPLSLSTSSVATLEVVRMGGTIGPSGTTFEAWACGHVGIHAAGGARVSASGTGDRSLLDWILLGGSIVGMDAVPGLRPDLDMDADGLEDFVIDDEGYITGCVDGDRSVIEGASCWQDPRMADAFSMTLDFVGVSARWAGREPGWEYRVPAGGAPRPHEESFFSTMPPGQGPCAELDALCDPTALSPCCDPTHRCSGADSEDYRCYAPCEPSRCSYGDRLGACVGRTELPEPVCETLGQPIGPTDCTPGEGSCTTDYGAAGHYCYSAWDGNRCVERCSPATAPCAEDHRCVPNAFEDGGVCAFTETSIPEG